MSKWVSVKDRLPDLDEDVLISWNDNIWIGNYTKGYTQFGVMNEGEAFWVAHSLDSNCPVKHWMTLPDKPMSGWKSIRDELPGWDVEFMAYHCDSDVMCNRIFKYVKDADLYYTLLGSTITHWLPALRPPEK